MTTRTKSEKQKEKIDRFIKFKYWSVLLFLKFYTKHFKKEYHIEVVSCASVHGPVPKYQSLPIFFVSTLH